MFWNTALVAILWAVWEEGNQRIFEDKSSSEEEVL